MADETRTGNGGNPAAEEDWGVFLELLGDYIFIIDSKGYIIHANTVASKRFAYSIQELSNMNIFDLYPPERSKEAEDVYSQIIMGERFICDIPLRTRAGGLIEVETKVTTGRWRGRDVIFSISRDVSAGKVIQYELRLAFEKLRSIIISISGYIWSAMAGKNEKFSYIFQSPVIETLTGRSADYFLTGPDQWLGIVHPDDAVMVSEMYGRLIRAQSFNEDNTYRIFYADGTVRWVRDSILAREFGDGQVRLDGVITDVTERRQAIQALEESESRLKAILSSMSDMVFAFDRDTRFTFYHTPEMGDLYIEPVKFINQKVSDVMPPSVSDKFLGAFEEAREGRELEFEYSLPIAGRLKWFSTMVTPIRKNDTFDGVVTVIRDITRQKVLEDSLERSENMFRLLAGSIGEGYVMTDMQGRITEVNQAFPALLGYGEDDVSGMLFRDLVPAPGRAYVEKAMVEDALAKGSSGPIRAELLAKKGDILAVELTSHCVRDRDGEPRGVWHLVRRI